MTHMLGQAKHRLKELEQSGVDTEPIGEAIEALEGELSAERGRIASSAYFMTAVAARDAVIAEALAALDPPHLSDPSEHADYAEGLEDGAAIKSERIRAILSRVPQGAAEPNPYEAMAAKKRDAEDDDRDWERPDVTSHINRPQYDAEEGNR